MNYKCQKCGNYQCVCEIDRKPPQVLSAYERQTIQGQVDNLLKKRREILLANDPPFPNPEDLPADKDKQAKIFKEYRLDCNAIKYTKLRAIDQTIGELEIKLR